MQRWLVTLVIPVLFLLTGAFGRKLTRKKPFQASDWYLGVEALLAAFTMALVYILDIAIPLIAKLGKADEEAGRGLSSQKIMDDLTNVANAGVFLCITFLVFLYVLAVHQDWEDTESDMTPPWRPWKRKGFVLGFWSNLLGFGALIYFLLGIKA